MSGIKNYNLNGVSSDLQLGKRGGRMVFDEQEQMFKMFMADGTTFADVGLQDLTINGNLTVLGDTTTINVETVTVQDNVIELNSGEEGAGVTAGKAGIEIDRGTEENAQLIWDELTDTFKFQLKDGTPVAVEGEFVVPDAHSLYRESDGKVVFDTTNATSETAEYLSLRTEENQAFLTARNEAGSGDVDLVLSGQGNGTVIFTSETGTADGLLGSQAGTDLTLSAGSEDAGGDVGNVFIRGGAGSTSTGGDVVLSGGDNGGSVRIDITNTTINDTSTDDTIATVGYVKTKFTEVSDDLGTLEGRVDTIDGQIVTIDGRLDTVEGRVDTVDGQIVTIDGRLDTAEGRLDTVEGRVDTVDGQIVTIDGRLDTVEGRVDTVDGQIVTIDGRLDAAEGRLDTVEGQIANIDTDFIASSDTPETYGTAGQYVVINSEADGLEFVDLPEIPTDLLGLSDTPEAYGTAGQYVVINSEGDGVEFVDLPEFSTTILELDDTPETYGTAGQVLGVNSEGDGIEYIDLPSSIMEFTDTPSTMGTTGQVLLVSEDGTTLEFGEIEPPESVLDLGDTPETYGTPGQVLGVNATGDGVEFIDTRTLSAIEVSDMNSAVSTIDATVGAYVTIAEPQEYTDSDGTTDGITVQRITIRVGSTLDNGEGFRIIVENEADSSEASVIAEAAMTDVEAGVYVIDGIFQNVGMSPLQRVRAALVDSQGAVVSATSGTVSVFVEYKTNIS